MKSKGLIGLLVVGVILLLFVGQGCGKYNSLAAKKQDVNEKQGNVQNQYQRRIDLLGNLANAVKGQLGQEQQIFSDIANARARMGSTTLNATDANAVREFNEAQGQIGLYASRLMSVVENYPDVKSGATVQTYMAQLEGTENRIAVARNDYNEAARDYNTERTQFPGSLVAGFGNFGEAQYFTAITPGADQAPSVDITPNAPRPAAPSRP